MNDPFGYTSTDVENFHKAVLVAVDAMLQQEMLKVMSPGTTGEARIHSAGRMDALNDVLVELQDKRTNALKAKVDQSGSSEA